MSVYEVDRKSTSVQSVDRAVTVMEFLARRKEAGVTEVANELGTHKSTAYRLLTTLRDRGLIEQNGATDKYRLGFGLVLLAASVTAELDVLRCARPVCERLSEELQENVTLAVLEDDDAVVVHQTLSKSSALSVDWTGQHTPIHATAAGKVFLAYMPEAQRRRILGRPLERFTENTLVDRDALEEGARETRKRGFGYTVEELEVGLNAVGAPVRSPDGEVVAAVSVSGPVFRMEAGRIPEVGDLVAGAAGEISRCLGFRG
ncbi:Transcriptional regulator [Rubrobacter radiotolerans]|uniref:Glycerol operon regulatory protein n=1 Tax=Rubrobacter radiotolerans TaxID=42256 RepID=A0A023X0B1_RUBRA|nr:IclR family transcriptional regulator [Rubrobacter radiotolerans]AHY45917.1 Transcriptional regulator [Rubrobacter radiotolerans]MDX5893331.1 IclR family transcriptional regulator [Rubrobacter radiotolerans]SMC03519.1 transcriptional regulator, IclR family [Rubrobacter radiotolerans DSM 5868]